jgi:hypothetical protein
MVQPSGAPPLYRCLLVLLAATCAAATLLELLLPDVVMLAADLRTGTLDAAGFDLVLVGVAELALAACAVWLWTASVVIAADAVRGRSPDRRGIPDSLRRVVLVACGLALTGGIATQAQADEPEPGHRTGRHLVEGLPLPDRATTTMQVSRVFARAATGHQRARTTGLEQGFVVVRPGDTLWGLARRALPEAGDPAVAEHVRNIHAANRAVIGADPDLIRPGQRLRMPRT